MIWVLNANSNTCRIYQYDKHPAKITLVKEIQHPENRLKKSEYLTSDKPGRYRTDNSTGGAYSPPTDPKEVEIEHFAREIAGELNQGRNSNAYKKLIMITTPHMAGLLAQHMDKHVKELVNHKIQKDVVHLTDHELLEFVREHTKLS